MGFGLTDLITLVGDENLEVQHLDSCLLKINIKPRDTEVTFLTKAIRGNDSDKAALIVWFERSGLDNAFKELNKGNRKSMNYNQLLAAYEGLKTELALVIDGNEAEINNYKYQLAEVCAERDALKMAADNPPA